VNIIIHGELYDFTMRIIICYMARSSKRRCCH